MQQGRETDESRHTPDNGHFSGQFRWPRPRFTHPQWFQREKWAAHYKAKTLGNSSGRAPVPLKESPGKGVLEAKAKLTPEVTSNHLAEDPLHLIQ